MDIKKEKKNYVSPSIRVVTLETHDMILQASSNFSVGSGGYENGDDFEITY